MCQTCTFMHHMYPPEQFCTANTDGGLNVWNERMGWRRESIPTSLSPHGTTLALLMLRRTFTFTAPQAHRKSHFPMNECNMDAHFGAKKAENCWHYLVKVVFSVQQHLWWWSLKTSVCVEAYCPASTHADWASLARVAMSASNLQPPRGRRRDGVPSKVSLTCFCWILLAPLLMCFSKGMIKEESHTITVEHIY